MTSGPSQEPTLRGEQTVDAAFVTVVLALFVAAAFGLTELPGGDVRWAPKEWKGVHDAAKALLLPLLALRLGLALNGEPHIETRLRNRVWLAMALCWIGDIALTFSGEVAFLVGLVCFLSGHLAFILAFSMRLGTQGVLSVLSTRVAAGFSLLVVLAVVLRELWVPSGELAPAIAIYATVIASMAFCSWSLAAGPGVWPLRIGATAFMASDVILALGRFGGEPIPQGHFWVMATYIAAQWLLTVGFTAVLSRRATIRP